MADEVAASKRQGGWVKSPGSRSGLSSSTIMPMRVSIRLATMSTANREVGLSSQPVPYACQLTFQTMAARCE